MQCLLKWESVSGGDQAASNKVSVLTKKRVGYLLLGPTFLGVLFGKENSFFIG